MNILADTNIWCHYFRYGEPTLTSLIEYDFLAIHPLVIGELSMGTLPKRQQTIKDLHAFPRLRPTSYKEIHVLLEEHTLWGKGHQWNDLAILASVLTTPGTLLWTKDKRLAETANILSVNYEP